MLKRRKFPEEIPYAVRLAIMSIRKNLGHPSKELLCCALRIGGANKIEIRAASEHKCDVCAENKPPEKSFAFEARRHTHTEFNQGVGVDLFVLADSNDKVFEFLNIVHLATRFNICFPCRPEGQIYGSSWHSTIFHCIRSSWQNGLVQRNGGISKAAARKTIKDVGARGFVEMRRLASMVNWAKNARINSSDIRQPNRSPFETRVVGRGLIHFTPRGL